MEEVHNKEQSGPRSSQAAAPDHKPPNPSEAAPDPSEDDLDDLDGKNTSHYLLDEFSAAEIAAKPDNPRASGPGRPDHLPPSNSHDENPPSTTTADDDDKDAFEKQLQEQMAFLMGEIDNSPETRHQLELMMKDISNVVDSALTADDDKNKNKNKNKTNDKNYSEKTPPPPADPTTSDPFQAAILQTIARMQSPTPPSQPSLPSTSQEPSSILTSLLHSLQQPPPPDPTTTGPSSPSEDESSLTHLLAGMMDQLTAKEILYEPMKELHDKFPPWMRQHAASCSPTDLKRYEEQQRVVAEIVARFERDGFEDGNVADRAFVVERMQAMQAAGNPPADLVGNMKDAQEALGELDSEGCAQQ